MFETAVLTSLVVEFWQMPVTLSTVLPEEFKMEVVTSAEFGDGKVVSDAPILSRVLMRSTDDKTSEES